MNGWRWRGSRRRVRRLREDDFAHLQIGPEGHGGVGEAIEHHDIGRPTGRTREHADQFGFVGANAADFLGQFAQKCGARRFATTDAAARGFQVKEAFRPAEDTYRPVVYPAAVVAGARQPALAAAFIDLLLSREGQAVLSRFGFQPPPAGAR